MYLPELAELNLLYIYVHDNSPKKSAFPENECIFLNNLWPENFIYMQYKLPGYGKKFPKFYKKVVR